MDFDIALELHRRPDEDSAVGLAATRLKTCLTSDRNAITHDHRPGEGPRHPVQTIAPDGAPQWATNTEQLWNRIEWTERAGAAPVLFEARAPVPSALTNEDALRFGAAVAGFVAGHLRVPVSVVVLPGRGPWLMRGEEERRHVRLCFPTRALAGPDSPDGVLDRSGIGSGFGGRLPMVMNHHLAKNFVRTLTTEVMRLGSLPTPPLPPVPSSPLTLVGGAGQKRELSSDRDDLLSIARARKRVGGELVPLESTRPPPPNDPARYPLVTRLRREAPRGMDIMELRDFEHAMDLSVEVEDALRDVTDQEREHINRSSSEERLQAHILEHRYLLDEARRRRSRSQAELHELGRQKGLLLFFRGQFHAAVLARAKKANELDRAKIHVRELKASIHHQQQQLQRARGKKTERETQLAESRARLKFSIRSLAGNDPRVLTHLTGIVDDVQRAHLKACMDSPAKPTGQPGKAESEESEGKSGPPSHPAPPGSRRRAGMG